MAELDDHDEYIWGPAECAKALYVSKRTLYRMINNGTAPRPRTIGGRKRWSPARVRAWLNEDTVDLSAHVLQAPDKVA